MKNTTTEDMKELLGSFHYEFSNLRFSLYHMFKTGKLSPTGELDGFFNMALVDFLVHIRILYEFFYGNAKSKDKAHAGNYIENWDKTPPSDIKDWKKRINIFLSHLSYARVTEEYKKYPIDYLYDHFRELTIDFLKNLPEKYLTKNLDTLLKEIEKEKVLKNEK